MRVRYRQEEEQIVMPGSRPLTLRLPPRPFKSGKHILRATVLPLCPSNHNTQTTGAPPMQRTSWCQAALCTKPCGVFRTGLETAPYQDILVSWVSPCHWGQAPAPLCLELSLIEDWGLRPSQHTRYCWVLAVWHAELTDSQTPTLRTNKGKFNLHNP